MPQVDKLKLEVEQLRDDKKALQVLSLLALLVTKKKCKY